MNDFEKELEAILADDPLGLLDVKPKQSSTMTADARLIASFEEINDFVREKGHEPTASRDITERKLFSRLKGLRESPEKAEALLEYDEFKLLTDVKAPEKKEINTIEDVLADDVLGLLDDNIASDSDPNDIFKLTNVPKAAANPDHVAKRKPCKEFDQFEPLFKQCQLDLATKERVLVPFKSERQIRPNTMFVLQGMLCYVAGKGSWQKRGFGNVDARLYCIFENGTESNMLLRSLASALWKDENGRQVIASDQLEMFNETSKKEEDDEVTGYIYVLRSLSADPKIQEVENLYKIGFSSQPVADRISKASKEPTYLMADVAPVVEFETLNLNPQKLELLLHTFFASACLNLDVFDSDGKRYTPREWFTVPLHIIETAVELLVNGEIVNYHYDEVKQEIVPRKTGKKSVNASSSPVAQTPSNEILHKFAGLRCLSLHQPYADWVVSGLKRVENRSWTTDYRGPLLIHASSRKPHTDARTLEEAKELGQSKQDLQGLPTGCIVGSVEFAGVISRVREDGRVRGPGEFLDELQKQVKKFEGKLPANLASQQVDLHYDYGIDFWWIFTLPQQFERPIPCKGALRLWKPPAEILNEIASQYSPGD